VSEQEVLNYLNTYGPQPIILAHGKSGKLRYSFAYQDFTNDGIPELAFVSDLFYIYGCSHGKYQLIFTQTYLDGYVSPFAIQDIQDGNRNGLPEIMFFAGQETQGGHSYRLYEWDGSQFQNLLVSEYPDDPDGGEIFVDAVEGRVEFRDLDHDGVQELVSTDGIPIWEVYVDGLPWRIERHFYRWDGNHYVDYHQEFDPPEYRFQAVQDGDRLSLSGDYDRALDLYQQAILSNNLKGWSPELRKYLQDTYIATPVKPTPISDRNEYYSLAAYARYQIMLLHLVRGRLPEAQVVYNTLQERFGGEEVGHLYAELAAAFWADYLVSQSIEQACHQAIEYAALHKIKMLHYLGNIKNTDDLSLAAGNLSLAFDHGYQSLVYSPADVCPFK